MIIYLFTVSIIANLSSLGPVFVGIRCWWFPVVASPTMELAVFRSCPDGIGDGVGKELDCQRVGTPIWMLLWVVYSIGLWRSKTQINQYSIKIKHWNIDHTCCCFPPFSQTSKCPTLLSHTPVVEEWYTSIKLVKYWKQNLWKYDFSPCWVVLSIDQYPV